MKAATILLLSVMMMSCVKTDEYRYTANHTMNSCDGSYESVAHVGHQYVYDHELSSYELSELIISDSLLVIETHRCSDDFYIYLAYVNGVSQ